MGKDKYFTPGCIQKKIIFTLTGICQPALINMSIENDVPAKVIKDIIPLCLMVNPI